MYVVSCKLGAFSEHDFGRELYSSCFRMIQKYKNSYIIEEFERQLICNQKVLRQ